MGPCECVEDETYAKLNPLLKDNHIVDWPFQLCDGKSRYKINYKLEGLNKVSLDVYVMPLVEPNLASRKYMCVVDLDFVCDFQQTLECLVEEVEIQDLNPLDDCDHPLPPHPRSRVSGESNDYLIQSPHW